MPALTTAQRIRATVGVAVIFGTWFYLVFTRPTDWESVGGSSPALITLGGYVLGAILLLSASLPILPARTIAIIPAALVLNIVIGQIVGSVGIPLYLDSVGTVLVAGLAGPIAGLATGTLSSIVWGLFNPAALPFAAVSAMVGLLSGVMIAKGMLRNIPLTITAGAVLGSPEAAAVCPGGSDRPAQGGCPGSPAGRCVACSAAPGKGRWVHSSSGISVPCPRVGPCAESSREIGHGQPYPYRHVPLPRSHTFDEGHPRSTKVCTCTHERLAEWLDSERLLGRQRSRSPPP